MNDDLPEIFDQIPPQPASPALRARTLAAVETELAKRRKPRWERVLERSVAAAFLFGVGLNGWQMLHGMGTRGSQPMFARQQFEDGAVASRQREHSVTTRLPMEQQLARLGPFDQEYSRLLVELLDKPAG